MRCAFGKSAYDIECATVSGKRYYAFYALQKNRKDSWKCHECQSKVPKTGNTNTSVRSAVQEGLEHHAARINSPNNTIDQNVTKRANTCQRFAVEEQEDTYNLIKELDGNNAVAGNIMAELKLFSDKTRAACVEIGMF